MRTKERTNMNEEGNARLPQFGERMTKDLFNGKH
jgi:hypothetical protein